MLKKVILKGLREGLGRLIVFISFITRPSKIKRSQEAQAQVNNQVKNLALYQFYACPFCVKTRRVIHKLNLPMTYLDAKAEPFRTELANGGGRIKVPCLRIEEAGEVRWMYESNDIIDYLNKKFG